MSFKLLDFACKHCGGRLGHIEACFRKGTHGDDPRSMHEILCTVCNRVFHEQEGYPCWTPNESLLKQVGSEVAKPQKLS